MSPSSYQTAPPRINKGANYRDAIAAGQPLSSLVLGYFGVYGLFGSEIGRNVGIFVILGVLILERCLNLVAVAISAGGKN
jgi:hypothetical protein